jgi:virginiamycin B lyase
VHVTDGRLRAPDGVWVGADGGVWFADTAADAIGRYQPGAVGAGAWRFTGEPPEADGPFDIKAGPDPDDGTPWFTNKSGNSLAGSPRTADRPSRCPHPTSR